MSSPHASILSWRFTLRELFLAILAIAAFLGWGLSLYRDAYQQRSPFFDTFEFDVLETLQDVNQPQFPLQEQSFGQRGKGSGYHFEQFCFKLAPSQTGPFMDNYRKRICEQMTKQGCTVDDDHQGFEHHNVQWFAIGYHHRSLAGSVRVTIAPSPNDEAQLSILIYEGRKP